ncbi:hypothetical protein NDU88_003837 [Pleurodeles waltl]|uniref:Uncharacterized protein n=1 Tax=Pleurodeles waltl TaxID=8319 RepID=A0AAV7LMP6_PLEWA|nr:hypothetical protein NDU88_003837 [Pleurodeles waltl]
MAANQLKWARDDGNGVEDPEEDGDREGVQHEENGEPEEVQRKEESAEEGEMAAQEPPQRMQERCLQRHPSGDSAIRGSRE